MVMPRSIIKAKAVPLSQGAHSEYDSVYFLKIVAYVLLGTLWIAHDAHRVLPLGLIIGLIIVQHEKLQIDRKIEYAMLLVGALLGLMGLGLTILV